MNNKQWLAEWHKRDREINAEFKHKPKQENDMNMNDVYGGSSFLKAEDLKGSTVKLTVESVGTHTFNQGEPDEKTQIVVSFVGKEKKLGLNVTNAKAFFGQLGDDTNDWNGKEIKLYPTTTDFAGKEVDCIRVVQELPPEIDMDESIPF